MSTYETLYVGAYPGQPEGDRGMYLWYDDHREGLEDGIKVLAKFESRAAIVQFLAAMQSVREVLYSGCGDPDCQFCGPAFGEAN